MQTLKISGDFAQTFNRLTQRPATARRSRREKIETAARSCVETLEARRLLSAGLDFSGGFNDTTGLTLNNVQLDAVRYSSLDPGISYLELGGPRPPSGDMSSVWSTAPQDITQFNVEFTFAQFGFRAGGFTFTLQGNNNTALGDPGGYLGYAGLPNSIALIFANDSTGLYEGGAISPNDSSTVNLPAGIDFSGSEVPDSIDVALSYDGQLLTETISDANTGVTFNHSYLIDIAAQIGSNSAFVGFTGTTTSDQGAGSAEVLSWRYAGPNAPAQPQAPSNLQADTSNTNGVNLSWQNNADNAEGYLVYRKGFYESSWSRIASLPADAISFADTSVGTSQFQAYQVRAHNASGLSDPATATTGITPGGPVNRWAFDDGALAAAAGQDPSTVTTAADINFVRAADNGTLTGPVPPVWVGGTSAQPPALLFGGGGGVTLDADMMPMLEGTATLTAWINTTEFGGVGPQDSPSILGTSDGSNRGVSWGWIDGFGEIGLTIGQYDGSTVSSDIIVDGRWHLVALSRDASTGEVDIYVDGHLSRVGSSYPGTVDDQLGGPFSENLQTIGAETLVQQGSATPVGFNYFNGMLRDVRVYNRVLSAQEVSYLFNPPTPSAPATVSLDSIAVDLQSAVLNIQGDPTQPAAAFTATTSEQVSAFLNAVGGVYVSPSSTPASVTLDAPGVMVQASQLTVPPNMVLTINGVTFDPDVPALTLTSGNLALTNCTLITTGNAPTILVDDGSLTLRNDIVQESSGYAQAAIEIDGGSVDLGSASAPGGNTLDVNGAGVLLRSGSAGPLIQLDPNAGNTFQINSHTASADDNLQGLVWTDFNNDGFVDFGEAGIGNIPITLAGTDLLGNPIHQTLNTDANGIYNFSLLWPGTYSISEGAVPSAYTSGQDSIGTAGGGNPSHSLFSNISIGVDQNGLSYNFGQQPAPGSAVAKGQAAGIGFWANKNGQALINKFIGVDNSNDVNFAGLPKLSSWLAETMPDTFGLSAGANNLRSMSPAQVAAVFLNDFLLKDKLDAQVMATALNVYATDLSLGGNAAASYGFTIGTYGLGDSTWNIGSDGAAFNVGNNSTLTVMQILQDWDHQTYKTSKSIRQMALDIFGGINAKGGL